MSGFPIIVPGTATLAYLGTPPMDTPSSGVIVTHDAGTLDVLHAIQAADMTQEPAVLVIFNLTTQGVYTGSGVTASIGGNPMSVIMSGTIGPDINGTNMLTALCLLSFDASTVFTDASVTLTIPGTGAGGPPYVTGGLVLPRLLYNVDPVLNFGFGAGYVDAGALGVEVLTTPPVAALTGDFAVASWTNSAVGGNGGYTITDPADYSTHSPVSACNGSVAYRAIPSDGPYSAVATYGGGGGPFSPHGAAVLLALLRGSPPDAVFVPDIVGDVLSVGEAALVAVGLVVGAITSDTSYTIAAGSIISTDPVAGFETLTGHSVAIVVSSGPPPLWALTPDWATPVREKLGFLTDVLPAWTGYEQRRMLRIAPRRVFSFSTIASQAEKRYVENTLFAWSALVWSLPIFPDGQRLPDPISISDTTIACDTVDREFVNGGFAIAIQDALTTEVFQISTVASNLLNLMVPAVSAWPAGTRLYPLRNARLLSYPKILHDSQQMLSVSIDFTIVEPCDWPAASGLATYRTLPVLEDSPDVSSAGAGDYSREANITDSITGVLDVDDTAQLGFPGNIHQWFLKGRTARSNFRKLLYLLKGRAGMIWVPSYDADLMLVGSLGSSAVAMTVEACGLARLAAVQNRRDIRIELTTGAIYYRRLVSAAAGMTSATEVVTLDSALGSAIAAAQVRRISFMALSRLDADEIEITHLTMADGIATAQTPFRAINYEPSV
jgi:hypothetical protein